jgi:protein sex-lethal
VAGAFILFFCFAFFVVVHLPPATARLGHQAKYLTKKKMASAAGSDNTPSSSPNPGSGSSDDSSRTNLIINYLPQNLTESELFKMFVTIGTVTNCKIMRDFRTGYSYGFGFVNYQKADDAIRAIQTLNGLQIQNKRIKVSYARPPGEDRKETNLYVTNLPRDVTEDELTNIFSAYGNIVQMNLLKDKITGMPRGVAFVRFDKREEAISAIEHLNGTIPLGRTNPISVKIAEEHGKQKAAYFAGWEAGRQQARRNIGAQPQGGMVGHGGHGGHGGRGGGGGHYNTGLPLASRPPNAPSFVPMGQVRPDKGSNNSRYNPIGMGGGYNVYNWN